MTDIAVTPYQPKSNPINRKHECGTKCLYRQQSPQSCQSSCANSTTLKQYNNLHEQLLPTQ